MILAAPQYVANGGIKTSRSQQTSLLSLCPDPGTEAPAMAPAPTRGLSESDSVAATSNGPTNPTKKHSVASANDVSNTHLQGFIF